MDGRKGRISRSLQFRLSVWLSLAIVLVAVAAGFLSFSYAFREAIELQDDQLRQQPPWCSVSTSPRPRSRLPVRRTQTRSRA